MVNKFNLESFMVRGQGGFAQESLPTGPLVITLQWLCLTTDMKFLNVGMHNSIEVARCDVGTSKSLWRMGLKDKVYFGAKHS